MVTQIPKPLTAFPSRSTNNSAVFDIIKVVVHPTTAGGHPKFWEGDPTFKSGDPSLGLGDPKFWAGDPMFAVVNRRATGLTRRQTERRKYDRIVWEFNMIGFNYLRYSLSQ